MVPRSPLYILSPTHPLFLSGLRPQGSLLASWPEHTFYWLPATLVSWGPRPFFPHTSDVDFGSLCLALFRFVWRWGAPASFFSASPFFKIKFTPHVFPFLQGSFFSVAFPSLLWFCLWMWSLEWVRYQTLSQVAVKRRFDLLDLRRVPSRELFLL